MDKRNSRTGQGQPDDSLFRIAPYYYLHVLDQNSNVTRLEIGPKTYVRQDNEKVIRIFLIIVTRNSPRLKILVLVQKDLTRLFH